MRQFIAILFIFTSGNSFCQSNLDFNYCLLKITELEELQSSLFCINGDNEEKILCIEGESFLVGDTNYHTDASYFANYSKRKVYVESRSFIEGYEVGYWLRIDSVKISATAISLFISTTSLMPDTTKVYFQGEINFYKPEESWILKEKYFSFVEYNPPFIGRVKDESLEEYRNRIDNYFEGLINKKNN